MARRTFADYKAAIVHALGAEPSSGETSGEIVNDALQELCSMRSWRWRRGGPVSLDFVANQSYIELPQDFGEEEVITYPGSVAKQMIRVTMAELEKMRATTAQPVGFSYYYAINSGSLDDSAREEGLTVNLIELYPTPTADVTDAITLTYLRNVDRLEDDADVPQIPPWMDFSLDLLCRAMAKTLEDDDPSNAFQVAFEKKVPQLFRRDSATQSRLGVMKGGLYPRSEQISPMYPSSIGDPSESSGA